MWFVTLFYSVVVLVGIVLLFTRQHLKKNAETRFEHVVVEIIVSKNVDEETRGPLAAEQVFSNIHSIYEKALPALSWFGDVQPRSSIEIVNIEGRVHFYMWVRKDLVELFESQVYAQYPDVEIYPREDYTDRLKDFAYCVSFDLALQKPYIYPIKKYKQFEDSIAKKTYDSLAGIVSALSKLQHPEDLAFVQIMFTPLSNSWHKKGLKQILFLSQGSAHQMRQHWLKWSTHHSVLVRLIKIIFFPVIGLWLTIKAFIPDDKEMLQELERLQRGEEIRDDTIRNSLLGKIAKLGFEVNLRVGYASQKSDRKKLKGKMQEIAGSFKQFNLPHLNGFEIVKTLSNKDLVARNVHERAMSHPFVFNSEELASLFHLPILTLEIPNIELITSKSLPPPMNVPVYKENDEKVALLGKVHFRHHQFQFGIRTEDRRRHIYVIGKTGMGKSTLLENMVYADIMGGRGVAVVDPHGDLADKILTFVPNNRTNDVIVFDPSDTNFPVSFNMLENVSPEHRSLIASGLVGVFKKLYAESWGPRLEYILRNTILSLLEYPNSTMLGIMRILTDEEFRAKVVNKISDPVVKTFWLTEYNKFSEKQRIEAISPIQNKVGQFLSSNIVRNIVGQPKSAFSLRWAMDNKKIVVVNLSKGKIGEDNSALLGSMIITKFQLDAMSRANIEEKDRVDFYLYVDEFQNFATNAFATILSEARKYRLNLAIANQYITQMPEEVRDAVFGNVGTIVAFQVGFDDGEVLSSQFNETVIPADLLQLPRGSVYMRMLVDNMPTDAFSAHTSPPVTVADDMAGREKVMKVSRERYGTKKELVEEKIKKWTESFATPEPPRKGPRDGEKTAKPAA